MFEWPNVGHLVIEGIESAVKLIAYYVVKSGALVEEFNKRMGRLGEPEERCLEPLV